jgi:hypothetical protein
VAHLDPGRSNGEILFSANLFDRDLPGLLESAKKIISKFSGAVIATSYSSAEEGIV